ncbi:MAG: hypothetical protein WCV83_00195 [Candidatus Magasanikbacteria bacterium]
MLRPRLGAEMPTPFSEAGNRYESAKAEVKAGLLDIYQEFVDLVSGWELDFNDPNWHKAFLDIEDGIKSTAASFGIIDIERPVVTEINKFEMGGKLSNEERIDLLFKLQAIRQKLESFELVHRKKMEKVGMINLLSNKKAELLERKENLIGKMAKGLRGEAKKINGEPQLVVEKPDLSEKDLANFEPDEIARSSKDITPKTKIYIGPLFVGIFSEKYKHLDYIYTSFPENRVHRETVMTGGKTKQQLFEEMQKQKIQVYDEAKFLMRSEDFSTTSETEQADFVRLTVRDLFNDSNSHTTDEIYERKRQLGLELCQSQDGPNYRLHYTNQPQGEWLRMGMKQITDADGYPGVFYLDCDGGGGLKLRVHWMSPGDQWRSGHQFVFRLSKYETK